MPVVYTSFILASFVALAISYTNLKKFNSCNFFFILVFIVAIAGFRSEYVGTDSLQYYLSFKELNAMALQHAVMTRYEQGYVFWVRCVGSFTRSPYVFFFITALLTLTVYLSFLKKYSINVFSSIIIFFCLNWTIYIVALRQSYATMFILLGVPFLLRKKRMLFVLFVVIAMQFHSAAMTAFFLIPLAKMEMHKKNIIMFCGGTIFLFFSMNLIWFLVGIFGGSYAQYMKSDFDIAGTNFINDVVIKIIPSIFIFCIGYYGCISEKTKEKNFFLAVCLFNICVAVIGLNSVIFTRLNGFFDFANPIVFSYFLLSKRIKPIFVKIVTVLFLLFFVSYFTVIQIERPNWMKVSPYSPCWAPVNAYGLYKTQYFW